MGIAPPFRPVSLCCVVLTNETKQTKMSIVEALKGIWVDVSQNMHTTRSKVEGITKYAKILGSEVAGIVSMVPYACKSWWLYSHGAEKRVQVKKNCRYGGRRRNVVDVYMPPVDDLEKDPNVLLFVHGGVWASGSKMHYAPMATRLAEEGIVTCVMEYSLYPSCCTDVMVGEVSQALDWVMDEYGMVEGGRKKRVFLVGHSAGAHLCAMSLLERSKSIKHMPDCFIGMAGVYDIAEHYEYERSREVHHLSTMKRAVGGEEKFHMNSPTVVLKHSLQSKNIPRPRKMTLHGEKIPVRVGLVDKSDMMMHEEHKHRGDTADHHKLPVLKSEHVERIPKTYLMASCADITVPWTESSEFHSMLHACGVQDSTLLLYHRIGHGDFVVDWKPKASNDDAQTCFKNLPEFAQDFLHIVK